MRARRLACFVAALAVLLADPAAAGGSFSVTTATTNTYSNTTWWVNWSTWPPTTITFHYPTGWRWAQQTGTSPVTPIPNDGDTVGTGTLTGRLLPLCTSANYTMTVTWESTVGGGSPASTVAELRFTVAGVVTFSGFVSRNGTNDYDLVIPSFPTTLFCSGSGSMTFTIYGTVPGTGRRITQNPATSGTYTATVVETDTSGVSTTSSNTVAIA